MVLRERFDPPLEGKYHLDKLKGLVNLEIPLMRHQCASNTRGLHLF